MTDAYHELLDDLSHTTTRIQEMAEKYADDIPAGTADDWGPPQVVAHLVDVDKLFRTRVQTMLSQETPYLKSWHPEVGPEGVAQELRPQLEAFANERGELISLLMNLPLKGWERTGVHDEHGHITVEELIEVLINHDENHLKQIETFLGTQNG
ncbi:MAG: DinB family protein [Nitrolancea sp.]